MASKSTELALECKRLSEGCLYTSTSLFIWLRFARCVKIFFIAAPLVLGSLAGWKLLTGYDLAAVRIVTAVCAFLAGLFPSIYAALKFDDHLDEAKHLASEFKNLQDRFRQAALVSSRKLFVEFEADVKPLIDRLEQARAASFTAPEWCFKRAQKKIKKGDYDFDLDLKNGEIDASR
jgi:hypothetical protein